MFIDMRCILDTLNGKNNRKYVWQVCFIEHLVNQGIYVKNSKNQ